MGRDGERRQWCPSPRDGCALRVLDARTLKTVAYQENEPVCPDDTSAPVENWGQRKQRVQSRTDLSKGDIWDKAGDGRVGRNDEWGWGVDTLGE